MDRAGTYSLFFGLNSSGEWAYDGIMIYSCFYVLHIIRHKHDIR